MFGLACILEREVEEVELETRNAIQIYNQLTERKARTDIETNLVCKRHCTERKKENSSELQEIYYGTEKDCESGRLSKQLGYMIGYGINGIEIDLGQVRKLYNMAIQQGNYERFMYHLGCLLQYADDHLMTEKARKAKKLYKKAVDHGNDVQALLALEKYLAIGEIKLNQNRVKKRRKCFLNEL